MVDLDRAGQFMATHARLLDRRRWDLLVAQGEAHRVLAALDAYRNDDGGYGSGLEPDLRSSSSQPVSALNAFEVFEEIAPATDAAAARLCDWLGSITLRDGGLPFALPVADPAGCAPFFLDADPTVSSLHMTSMLAAIAHRVARHDPAVREHPWLATATDYALDRIRRLDRAGHALELRFALQFLDAVHEVIPEAREQLRRLGGFLPSSGFLPVAGGAEDEMMTPLDFAPVPGRPIRELFSAEAIAGDLARLGAQQQADGGWVVDWNAFSSAASLEWRGWATVRAVTLLRANARV